MCGYGGFMRRVGNKERGWYGRRDWYRLSDPAVSCNHRNVRAQILGDSEIGRLPSFPTSGIRWDTAPRDPGETEMSLVMLSRYFFFFCLVPLDCFQSRYARLVVSLANQGMNQRP